MCPRELLSRKRGFMDFGLFEKIIREVSCLKHKPITHLHGFGEPIAGQACYPSGSGSPRPANQTHVHCVERVPAVSRNVPEDHRRGAGQDEDQLLRDR